MNCETFERRIDEYVDGLLDEAARSEADAHLAVCDRCRSSLRALREVLEGAAALPRHIEPPRDLFPEVRAAIEAGNGTERRRRVTPAVWLALAASLIVAVAAGIIGLPMLRPGTVPVAAEDNPPAAQKDAMAEYLEAEEQYIRATEQLFDALEKQGDSLPPGTAAIVQENLETIDQAIEQVRVALARDPGNPRTGQVLTALHRQKLHLLKKASRLSS
jgi:hypothetical protein